MVKNFSRKPKDGFDHPRRTFRRGQHNGRTTMKTKFRKSCPDWAKTMWPEQLEKALGWFGLHYPGVNLRRVSFEIIGGRQKSRHFRYTQPPRIVICPNPPCDLWFYARAARQIPGLKTHVRFPVPTPARICLPLVHELTHHLQMVRGIRYGNETDTTLNELAWLRDNVPNAFLACWDCEPLEIGVSRIERGKTHPSIEHILTAYVY